MCSRWPPLRRRVDGTSQLRRAELPDGVPDFLQARDKADAAPCKPSDLLFFALRGRGRGILVEMTPPAALPRTSMNFRWRLSAANTVIVSAAVLLLLVFAIFTFLCWQGYNATLTGARSKAESTATLVANDAAWMVGAGRGLLQQIAGVAEIPADLTAEQKAKVQAALASLPVRATLGLYDATGTAFGDGENPLLGDSIADLDVFKALEGGGNWTISPQVQSVGGGPSVFIIAQRLGSTDFGGVALLTIGVDVMEAMWTPLQLGKESTIALIRADGWLVARYPALPQTLQLNTAPPFTSLAAVDSGSYESARSPADGIARTVGFKRLGDLGLVAIASVSQDQILAQLWGAIITVLWLLGPIGVALLVGAIYAARVLRASARTQASLAAALAQNDVLFREIHHRVKNNLQTVSSLLQMQPIPREIKTNMSQRIAAMSAVHEHIYRSNNFSVVQVKDYLLNLIGSVHEGSGPQTDVHAEIADLAIDKDAATPLGLVLTEVLSNAFKHAFSDGRDGVVELLLREDESGWAVLTVTDNGVGFDPEAPTTGIGRRLIAGLTAQLKGEAQFTTTGDGGARFVLRFPLTA